MIMNMNSRMKSFLYWGLALSSVVVIDSLLILLPFGPGIDDLFTYINLFITLWLLVFSVVLSRKFGLLVFPTLLVVITVFRHFAHVARLKHNLISAPFIYILSSHSIRAGFGVVGVGENYVMAISSFLHVFFFLFLFFVARYVQNVSKFAKSQEQPEIQNSDLDKVCTRRLIWLNWATKFVVIEAIVSGLFVLIGFVGGGYFGTRFFEMSLVEALGAYNFYLGGGITFLGLSSLTALSSFFMVRRGKAEILTV